MGSYKEIKGDLLDLFDKGEFEVIAHGANCRCIMGAGIAKQIKERYPEAYYADLYDKRSFLDKFGDMSFNYDETIYNLYTQLEPGPNADLTAISMSLKKLNFIHSDHLTTIGLPIIGCGIGGLDWKDVKPIIQKELNDMDVTVVFYDK
jgi:O-acetyl-ADP-ribose deacetylase (regulator of RNase III)